MLLLMKCYNIIKFFKELLFCLKLIIYLQYENETNYIKYRSMLLLSSLEECFFTLISIKKNIKKRLLNFMIKESFLF